MTDFKIPNPYEALIKEQWNPEELSETYEVTGAWLVGIQDKTAELLGFVSLIEELSRWVVQAYDAESPLRTADVHPDECKCLRCAIDALRDALPEDPTP